MRFSRRQTLFALSALLGCSREPPASTAAPASDASPTKGPGLAPGQVRRETHAGVELLTLFTGGADASSPVLVAIHGRGDRPDAWTPDLHRFPGRAQVVVPRAFDPYGDGFTWFPLTRGLEASAVAEALGTAEERLFRALASIAAGRPLVVSGFSQGGMLSFALAARRGGAIRFAAPMAGMCPRALVPGKDVPVAPIVAFHGTVDPVIPFAAGQATVDAFRAAGHDARMTPYEGVPHALPPPMRADVYAELTRRLAS